VHLLNDDRGPVLEAVVSRMRALSRAPAIAAKGWPAARMRLVALSATLPNLSDVAAWIGAPREATFSFDGSYRPVPLTHHVLAFDAPGGGGGGGNGGGGGAFMFERSLDGRLFDVVDRYSSGRPALIFCASRNGARSSAERLVADGVAAAARYRTGHPVAPLPGGGGGGAASVFVRDASHAAQLAAAAGRAGDARLRECLRHGVGFHSAGETPSDRGLVESLFRCGGLPVLATTSTLAVGVNLPAHLVVVKSTQAWRGSGAGYREYSRAQILQVRACAACRGCSDGNTAAERRGVC
jgi:ATP-dependent DNA helicase HFM1/MER3